MTISNGLVNVIQILVKSCRKENISIVLMGGIAVSFYSRPRATYDIDGIVYIRENDIGEFLDTLDEEGFKYNKKTPINTIHNLPFLTLFYRKDKIYVDLFLAKNEFQKGIIERAKRIKFGKMMIDIISPEDLVLLKLQAGRERDTEDVRNIIYENFKTLDFKYLKKWAKRLGVKIFLDDEIKSMLTKRKAEHTKLGV